ncbi:TrkH family potassium uptake protein [Paenibacillus baekrokdamisoli]|nr:TrkH family potassium uptake protein [Paenibacillus baekrokdamisoli]
MSSVQLIVTLYFICVAVSSVLLYLPFFHKPGVSLSFMNAVFTAASAISVTGLSVISIDDIFNNWGIVLLIILFQIGGIGIMTMGTMVWLLFGQKIGLEQRIRIAADHNRSKLSGLVALMRDIIVLSLVIELIGAVLLGSHLLISGYETKWYVAYFHGIFASVSAFTNAGFDVYGNSLMNFASDYFYQAVTMVLIICGAIGFPVLIEVRTALSQRKLRKYKFSLFTKITTFTFAILIVSGTLFIFLFEQEGVLKGRSWHEALFIALFHSVSSRSGGLATIDIGQFSAPSLTMLAGMMFIGASPSSVGGGIRTTTIFVMVASVVSIMRGQKSILVFNRELIDEDVRRAYIVFFTAIALIFTCMLVLVWVENRPFEHLLFELCSAFGTTGLSTGITASLSATSKIILILTMFIGRIGIMNLLLFLKKGNQDARLHYPKEQVMIGQ